MNKPMLTIPLGAGCGSTLPRCGLLVAFVIAGCARGPLSDLDFGNPFRRAASVDKLRYGTTPADRVDELRAVAAGAEKMSSTEQQAVTEQLASRLRAESDPLMRRELVRAISAFSMPGAIAGLHEAMDDDDVDVRVAVCQGWQRMGGTEAVKALTTALETDPDVDIRLAAAKALGSFQDSAALNALVIALNDSDPALQRRARISLEQATGQDFGYRVDSWRRFVQNQIGASPDPAPGPQTRIAEPPHSTPHLQ